MNTNQTETKGIALKDNTVYKRRDGTLQTVGGTTNDYPEYVWTIQGDWYVRATGRYVAYYATRGYEPMSIETWRDLVEEVKTDVEVK